MNDELASDWPPSRPPQGTHVSRPVVQTVDKRGMYPTGTQRLEALPACMQEQLNRKMLAGVREPDLVVWLNKFQESREQTGDFSELEVMEWRMTHHLEWLPGHAAKQFVAFYSCGDTPRDEMRSCEDMLHGGMVLVAALLCRPAQRGILPDPRRQQRRVFEWSGLMREMGHAAGELERLEEYAQKVEAAVPQWDTRMKQRVWKLYLEKRRELGYPLEKKRYLAVMQYKFMQCGLPMTLLRKVYDLMEQGFYENGRERLTFGMEPERLLKNYPAYWDDLPNPFLQGKKMSPEEAAG